MVGDVVVLNLYGIRGTFQEELKRFYVNRDLRKDREREERVLFAVSKVCNYSKVNVFIDIGKRIE